MMTQESPKLTFPLPVFCLRKIQPLSDAIENRRANVEERSRDGGLFTTLERWSRRFSAAAKTSALRVTLRPI
jgi:hypothetical protein